MQCPNCHKEALNVNGRYVCLDCGIEISAAGTPVSYQPAPPPPVMNHTTQMGDAVPRNEETPAVWNNAQNQSQTISQVSPLPSVKTTNQVTPNTNTNIPSPEEFTPKEPSKNESNVRDYYLESLNKMAGEGAVNTSQVNSDQQKPNVVPDFPEPDETGPTFTMPPQNFPSSQNRTAEAASGIDYSSSQLTVEASSQGQQITAATGSLNQNNSQDKNQDSYLETHQVAQAEPNLSSEQQAAEVSIRQEKVISAPENLQTKAEESVLKNGVETNQAPQQESYFQPSQVNIAPAQSQEAAVAAKSTLNPSEEFDKLSTSLGVGAGEKVISEIEPKEVEDNGLWPKMTEEKANNEITEATGETSFLPEENAGLAQNPEDLKSGPTIVMPPQEPAPVLKEESSVSNLPGISNIPSAESVFGPDVVSSTEGETDFVMKKGISFKKVALVILAFLLLSAIVGGIIWGAKIFFKPKDTSSNSSVNSGKILNISGAVVSKMDEAKMLSNSFSQEIDFSKINVKKNSENSQKESELALFFSKSTKLNGNWKQDEEGDVSFDSKSEEKEDKRIFVKAEDTTYVFSKDTNSWIAVPGFQMNTVPIFYPIESRGFLLFATNTENIIENGTEKIGDKKFIKYKIIPKEDVVRLFIKSLNSTLFEGINYNSLKYDALSIYVYVDEENRFAKINVEGTIEIDSNYASGAINVKSEGIYNYEGINVTKPV